MIVGVGVDAVQISTMRSLLEGDGGVFEKAVFSEKEREAARVTPNPVERFAGLFAVKEAVHKALAPGIDDVEYDIRSVQVDHWDDGSPHVIVDAYLSEVMRHAGARSVLVSVTNEGDLAIAFAIAQSEEL